MEILECAEEWNTALFLRGTIGKKHFEVRGWLGGYSALVSPKKKKKNQNELA